MKSFFFLSFILVATTFFDASAWADSRVLIIGVSEYDDSHWNNLAWVENDVRKVETAFKKSRFETTTLSNKRGLRPTLSNVKDQVERICSLTRSNDALVVYFSGHGLFSKNDPQKSYLALNDSMWEREKNNADFTTCLPVSWIRRRLSELPSNRVILILDACHSGGTRTPYAKEFPISAIETGDGADVVTFASSRVSEKSGRFRINGETISFFTHWLVQGLIFADGNFDGVTSTDEIFRAVVSNVDLCKAISSKAPYKSIPDSQIPTIVHNSSYGSKSAEPFDLMRTVIAKSYEEAVDQFADQIIDYADLISSDGYYNVRVDDTKSGSAFLRRLVDVLRKKGERVGLNLVAEDSETDVLLVADVNSKRIDDKIYDACALKIKFPKLDRIVTLSTLVEAKEDGKVGKDAATPVLKKYVVDPRLPNVRFIVKLPDGTSDVRQLLDIKGEPWVELNEGETFQIEIDPSGVTSGDSYVGMNLLIDGVDSLNYGSRTSLDSTRLWALNAANKTVIKGYQYKNGADGMAYEFKVVEQRGGAGVGGLISFRFVELKKKTRVTRNLGGGDVVVVPGAEASSATRSVPYSKTGRVYGDLFVHYASKEKISQLGGYWEGFRY